MRHLTLTLALTSSVCVSAPNPFVTDSMSVRMNATPVAPVVDVRAASPNHKAFFSKVFTVATSNGRGIILETPEGRGEVRFDDKSNVKVVRRMSTDLIPIALRDTHSSTLRFVNGQAESRARHVTCKDDTSALLHPVHPRSPVPKPKELRVTLHYAKLDSSSRRLLNESIRCARWYLSVPHCPLLPTLGPGRMPALLAHPNR
jgi:hypothetical protein